MVRTPQEIEVDLRGVVEGFRTGRFAGPLEIRPLLVTEAADIIKGLLNCARNQHDWDRPYSEEKGYYYGTCQVCGVTYDIDR